MSTVNESDPESDVDEDNDLASTVRIFLMRNWRNKPINACMYVAVAMEVDKRMRVCVQPEADGLMPHTFQSIQSQDYWANR